MDCLQILRHLQNLQLLLVNFYEEEMQVLKMVIHHLHHLLLLHLVDKELRVLHHLH
jgi:hypothetical protein